MAFSTLEIRRRPDAEPGQAVRAHDLEVWLNGSKLEGVQEVEIQIGVDRVTVARIGFIADVHVDAEALLRLVGIQPPEPEPEFMGEGL